MAVVLVGIAAAVFGWRPGPGASLPAVVIAILVGTAAFAGIGLALAGTLRAEATLTIANALFIACLLLGGIVVPVDQLGGPIGTVSGLLPAAALAEALRAALGAGGDLGTVHSRSSAPGRSVPWSSPSAGSAGSSAGSETRGRGPDS